MLSSRVCRNSVVINWQVMSNAGEISSCIVYREYIAGLQLPVSREESMLKSVDCRKVPGYWSDSRSVCATV